MTADRERLFAVADRELTTVVRTPAYVLAAAGFVVVVLGLALASGLTGYVPLAVDLLAPVEVLVPLLAVAFGYRSLGEGTGETEDRKSTRLNSSHATLSRMPSSA